MKTVRLYEKFNPHIKSCDHACSVTSLELDGRTKVAGSKGANGFESATCLIKWIKMVIKKKNLKHPPMDSKRNENQS